MNVKFIKELQELINKHGIDARCNTADFIVASYLWGCIVALELTINQREKLLGKDPKILI